MEASAGNEIFKHGLTAIMNIVLTDIASNLTAGNSQCVANNFEPFNTSTILIAIRNTTLISPNWSTCSNKTFIIINEKYNKHFTETNYRVDFGVIVLDCHDLSNDLLLTIKKNRLISVQMKLVLFLGPRCRDSNQDTKNYLSIVHEILNPAYSMVVSDSFKTCWFRPKSSNFVFKKPPCDFIEEEIFVGDILRIVADEYDPYVLSPDGNGAFKEGIEIKIIHEFAKRMNRTIVWVRVPAGEPPRVQKNKKGEYAGVLGLLHRLEADIGIAGFIITPVRSPAIEFLIPHTYDSFAWIIPAAPKVQNWGAVTSVFSTSTWNLVALVFICFTCTSALILWFSSESHNYGHILSDSFTQALAILLDQGISDFTYHFLSSFIVMFYIMYCLIITNAYRSSLITALTTEYEGKWYETAAEYVADGGMSYLMISGRNIYEQAALDEPIFKTIMKPDRHVYVFSYSILIEVAAKRQGLVLCVANPCNTIILKNLMGPNMKPKLIALKEQFMAFPVAMLLAPGSPLQPALHKRTMWLMEAGMMKYWLKESDHMAMLKAYLIADGVDDDGPRNLSVNHLVLVFVALTFGLVLSLILFVLEILYRRNERKYPRNQLDKRNRLNKLRRF